MFDVLVFRFLKSFVWYFKICNNWGLDYT